jgi:CheY-like chemotaxis protein
MTAARPVSIVMAEDDDDDFSLCRRAFEEARITNPVHRVKDGEELMDLLLRRGAYAKAPQPAPPLLVLLDLRMPKKDGWEALAEIRAHPRLRRIPVIVLTTSKEAADVERCYELGSSSYIKKPVGVDELLSVAQAIKKYWLETAELPGGFSASPC